MLHLFLILLLIVAVFHVCWYLASRMIMNRPKPDEAHCRAFQETLFRRFGIPYDLEKIRAKNEEVYIESGGFRIHMDVLAAGEGRPAVVFIPGTTAYAHLYVELLYALYEKGFNVVGFDPRGHGRSSGPRGDYTIDEIVDDALAVARYARERFKTEVFVMGSSQGGLAAFYAAARDDSLAGAVCHNIADLNGRDNLILSGVRPFPFLVPLIDRVLQTYRSFAIPIALYLDLSLEKLKDGTDGATFVKEDPLCVTWISLRAMRSLMRTPLAKPVERIRVPIMLIHSDRDNIFPQAYVEGIYKRLTCAKEFLLAKDREHLVMTNNVPEVIGPITEWINRIASSRR